jgi:sec-independent protein translocase protein TatC
MDTDPRDDKELAATGKMSFLDHLDELRRRIIVAVAAVGISFVVCWIFHERIFEFLSVPITQHLGDRKLTYLSPTEPFMIYMKASFYAGIFLVSPVVLWQVWLFIAPGLYSREKRYAIPFLLSSSTLFVLGGVFAYQVGLPMTLNFLTNFGHAFQEIVTATFYFDFALVVILGCAIIFEIPIVIFFLSVMGITNARFLLRNLRYAVLIIFIVAAIITPTPDIPTLMVFATPMLLLYLVGILVAWIFGRKRLKEKNKLYR